MKTLLPCELSSQSPSLPFIRQFYVKQELCGLRRMETLLRLVSWMLLLRLLAGLVMGVEF